MGVFLALRGVIAFIPAFVWKWLAIAAIGGVLFLAGDIRGRRIEKAICEEAARAAQAAADTQDRQADKEVIDQSNEVAKGLLEQKKVDDETISELKARLERNKPAACLYDKGSADPDERPPADRMRLQPSRPRTNNKKSTGPASILAAGGRPKGGRWDFAVRSSRTAKAGDR